MVSRFLIRIVQKYYNTYFNVLQVSRKRKSGHLKRKLKEQGKLFFQNSSLHGVKYVAENERSFIERSMWFVWIAIGLITAIVIILNLWEKFQTNPTITGLDTDFHNWEVAFPAVTVCQRESADDAEIQRRLVDLNNKNVSFSDAAAKEFFVELAKLSLGNWKNLAENYPEIGEKILDGNSDVERFIYDLNNKCEQLFDVCHWKSAILNCCEIFRPVFTENGFCHTFNSKHFYRHIQNGSDFIEHFIEETDLKWSLSFQVKSKSSVFSIYILNSNEVCTWDSRPQHVWDFKIERALFSMKQTYTTEDAKQLNLNQRRCAFQNELQIEFDDTYSYTACATECRMRNAVKYCGCAPHFYPSGNGYDRCDWARMRCIARHFERIVSIEACRCPLGCLHTAYEIEKLDGDSSDGEESASTLEVKFVSWPMVRYKREVLFGWVDLLVSFGGIAGLFLGFSLLSAVEILYYFTIRLYCVALKKERPNRVDLKARKITVKGFEVPIPVVSQQRRLSFITLSKDYYY
ncbi:unnamed protein product [Phyllotreta striolata]|uniref:Sodium channel protein Nach n=1 Tax=Phyllotreta striolata TaxID=444603 RepID=A0A9N9XLS2_PHYSR|nr:unnamed protein product [Phyllotreta striolata]